MGSKTFVCPIHFWVKKVFGSKKVWSKIRGCTKLSPQEKFGSKAFGQNWGSNNCDITDMDKCHQDICCLYKCHLESWHLLKFVTGTLPSLVKIGSIAAEIMLIWTNVARTYIAWTNFIIMVGTC